MCIRTNLVQLMLAAIILIAAQLMPSLAHAHGGHAYRQDPAVATAVSSAAATISVANEGVGTTGVRAEARIDHASVAGGSATFGSCPNACCSGAGLGCCAGHLPATGDVVFAHEADPQSPVTVATQLRRGVAVGGVRRPPRALLIG